MINTPATPFLLSALYGPMKFLATITAQNSVRKLHVLHLQMTDNDIVVMLDAEVVIRRVDYGPRDYLHLYPDINNGDRYNAVYS